MVLSLCKETIPLSDEIINIAHDIENIGIKPLDALHLAVAASNKIKYLCTCDDDFIKKAKRIKGLETKVILPTDLIIEILR